MFDIKIFDGMSTEERYKAMLSALRGLTDGDESRISKLSNCSALINALVEDLNWCGFYLDNGKELELGPFQGMPACTKIPYDKGVCGKAYTEGISVRVDDVEKFPGHIACDAASSSELVIPVIKKEKKIGVLDMDSSKKNRFTELEEKYLKEAVDIIAENIFG